MGVSRAGSGDLARRDPEGGGLSPRVSAAVLAAAFAFFLLDCILLVASGPSLSTVHAFAAFIVIAIVAASNQLVPVLSGAPRAAPGAVILTSLPLVVGFAALIASFAGAPLFVPSGVLLGGGGVCGRRGACGG